MTCDCSWRAEQFEERAWAAEDSLRRVNVLLAEWLADPHANMWEKRAAREISELLNS